MATCTWSGTYKIRCPEFGLSNILEVQNGALDPRIVLRPAEGGIFLEVSLSQTEETLVRQAADSLAQRVFLEMLFRLAGKISWACAPQLRTSSFTPDTPPRASTSEVSITERIALGDRVDVVLKVTPTLVKPAVEQALSKFASPPTTKPQVNCALDVFLVGMATEDPVTRFLIHYNAATLLSEVTSGKSDQRAIDKLLCDTDSTIVAAPTGKLYKGAPTRETPYTKARNDFVHAHDRGKNPANARTAMSQCVTAFQAVVAKAISAHL